MFNEDGTIDNSRQMFFKQFRIDAKLVKEGIAVMDADGVADVNKAGFLC